MVKPKKPVIGGEDAGTGDAAPVIRTTGLIAASPRPAGRPMAEPDETVLVALAEGITDALAEVVAEETEVVAPMGADAAAGPEPAPRAVQAASLAGAFLRPAPRPVPEAERVYA